MKIEVDKTDIINMIRGTSLSYEKIDRFLSLGLGYYVGGFDDSWYWNDKWSSAWDLYTEEQLLDFYHELKEYEKEYL